MADRARGEGKNARIRGGEIAATKGAAGQILVSPLEQYADHIKKSQRFHLNRSIKGARTEIDNPESLCDLCKIKVEFNSRGSMV